MPRIAAAEAVKPVAEPKVKTARAKGTTNATTTKVEKAETKSTIANLSEAIKKTLTYQELPEKPELSPALKKLKIGEMVDMMYDIRAKRLAAEKEAGAFKVDEEALKIHLFHYCKDNKQSSAAGMNATFTPGQEVIGIVDDLEKAVKYAEKIGMGSIFPRKISVTAYRQFLVDGKPLPGVTPFVQNKYSLTKK